jgi:hypothetical protein
MLSRTRIKGEELLHEGWSSYDTFVTCFNCHGVPGKRYGFLWKSFLYTWRTRVKNDNLHINCIIFQKNILVHFSLPFLKKIW